MDRKKIKIAVLAAASGLLILAAGGITAKMVQDRKTAAIETARMERETKDKEKEEERRNAANEAAKEQDDKIMGFSAESAKRVKEALGNAPAAGGADGGKQEGICEDRILPDRRGKRKDRDRGFCGRNSGQR